MSTLSSPPQLVKALLCRCCGHSWLFFPVEWLCSLCSPIVIQCGDCKLGGKGILTVKEKKKVSDKRIQKSLERRRMVNLALPKK